MVWEYDFGDGWEHDVRLSSIEEYAQGEARKIEFVSGKRACPPEDCGGIWGYEELLELHARCAARKRISADARERLEWYGMDRDFDPEYLDIEECQEIVEAFNCDWAFDLRMMDIKSLDVFFHGSTFEESDPRVIDGRSGEAGSEIRWCRTFKNAMPMDFSRLNYEVMSDTTMCYESIPLLKYAVRESIRRQYMVEEGLGGVMWLIRSSAEWCGWSGARRSDAPDPELGVHEKGSFHGQTPDSHLGVHEKGLFHGQTPDPEPPSPRRDGPEVPVEGFPVPRTDRDRG